MNYTTLEQSKKLIELGLDPNTADMWYEQRTEDLGESFQGKAFVGKSLAIQHNSFSYRNGYVIPCWSLGALIELMPKGIYTKGCMCHLTTFHDLASIQYANIEDNYTLHTEVWGTADPKTNGYIFGVFSMVLWLLENNYIEKEFLNTKGE